MKRSDTLTSTVKSTAPASSEQSEESPLYVKVKDNKEKVGDYAIGKLIGTGSFGVVRLGRHKETNKQVAIKIVNKARAARQNATELVTREINIL